MIGALARRVSRFLTRDATVTPDSSSSARSHDRYRRVALTALSSLGARAISILTVLISVPLTVRYLGTERYGVWMTISSIIAVLAFADLGMGNGLLNAVSDAHGRDDREAAQRYVSSAFFMLSGLALCLGIVFAFAFPFISWAGVLNVSSPTAAAEAGPAMAVFVACLLLEIPLGIVDRIQLGYQEGFVNGLWVAFGSLLGLTGVLTAIAFKGGLPWLVLAMAGSRPAATLLNAIVLFSRRRPWLRPRWANVDTAAAFEILRRGILFFVLQLAVALAYTSDNLVANRVLGPEAVTAYAVPLRMFFFIPSLFMMVFNPLWPAYGEAIQRGDASWVRTALIRSVSAALVGVAPISALLVVFGVPIIHAWAGPDITPSFWLLLGMGCWSVLSTAGNAVAMFLNGMSIIRFQVITATSMALTALGAKIVLANEIGLPGIIWATVAAYLVFSVVPVAVYVPRLLTRIEAGKHEMSFDGVESLVVGPIAGEQGASIETETVHP